MRRRLDYRLTILPNNARRGRLDEAKIVGSSFLYGAKQRENEKISF